MAKKSKKPSLNQLNAVLAPQVKVGDFTEEQLVAMYNRLNEAVHRSYVELYIAENGTENLYYEPMEEGMGYARARLKEAVPNIEENLRSEIGNIDKLIDEDIYRFQDGDEDGGLMDRSYTDSLN